MTADTNATASDEAASAEQPDTPRGRVERQVAEDPAVNWLELEFTEVEEDRITVRMPVRDEMRNAFGIVHGGFPFLLADTAFAFCGTASGTPLVTHHANITYVAPAKGKDWIEAKAVLQRRYGRNVICDVTVTDSEGTVAAELRVHGVAVRKPDAR